MALRNHTTVLAVALTAMLCTVQAAYGQGPKKTTEELQYVPPPARVVHDSVIGKSLISTSSPSRYATVALTPVIDYDFCGMGCISKVLGRVGLSLDGASVQYDLGDEELEIDVTVEVQFHNGSLWDPLGSAIVFKLHVDNSSTPKKYRIHQEVVVDLLDYRGNKCGAYPSNIYDDLRLKVMAYNDHSAAAAITDSLKLYFRLEEYARIHPSSVEADGCSDGETMVKLLAPTADLATNPVTLSWENWTSAGGGSGSACDEAYPWYEVQVLRLYNTDAGYRNDPAKLKAVVNWSEAQRFILYGQATSMTFTLADGTGYYLWRVRPIGNWHEGGFGNDTNWGCWTPHPADGATINLSLTNSTPQAQVTAWRNSHSGAVIARSLFHYNQFDEDKNWIFNRTFMEGRDGRNGGYEGITYATGLLQPIQTQAASQTTGQVMVSHTVLDANGRPTLSVLPFVRSGVDNGKLEFLEGAALYGSAPYTWKDFDDAA